MKGIFVAGIGTGVGKTVIAAAAAQALAADYWKPVQSGSIEGTDSAIVRSLVSEAVRIHPERYCLSQPLSPHAAAIADKVTIALDDFTIPDCKGTLVIEGAGGLLVPINEQHLMIDLCKNFGFPVLLVSRNYLGSINHTLLSIEALKARDIPIVGIVFNGKTTPDSERVIENISRVPCVGRIPEYAEVHTASIEDAAARLKKGLAEYAN